MRATGIVRKIDELGRVVIPKEVRNTFDIKDGDPLEIFVNEVGEVILRKYQPGCIICGNVDNTTKTIHGKNICSDCEKTIKAV
jgi:transcriptional pleiotropic regulator of transition state genes